MTMYNKSYDAAVAPLEVFSAPHLKPDAFQPSKPVFEHQQPVFLDSFVSLNIFAKRVCTGAKTTNKKLGIFRPQHAAMDWNTRMIMRVVKHPRWSLTLYEPSIGHLGSCLAPSDEADVVPPIWGFDAMKSWYSPLATARSRSALAKKLKIGSYWTALAALHSSRTASGVNNCGKPLMSESIASCKALYRSTTFRCSLSLSS
jgi:hypothetical protein